MTAVYLETEPGRPSSLGWARLEADAPGGSVQTHIVPVNDITPHRMAETCGCRPVEHEPGEFAHNAWDGRERLSSPRHLN